MFQHILVPVDFTSKNRPALDAACRLASRNQARVTLLHVIEKVDYIATKELKVFYRTLEENAREKMKGLVKVLKDITTEQQIVYGKRAEEIVKCAVQNGVDLIIVSSHKVSPEAGWGTLSYKIGILSQCSVLLVK